MRLKRPSQDVIKRLAAFALVIFLLFVNISILDLANDNAKLASDNADRVDTANAQMAQLLKQNEKQSSQLDEAQDQLDTLITQNKALIRQLRQAGLDPIFDEEDLGNESAKPNRSKSSNGGSSSSSFNSGGTSNNSPNKSSSPGGDGGQKKSQPKESDKPPPKDEQTPTGSTRDSINDTIDAVEKTFCSLVNCLNDFG